jgi:hypothetical protein
MPFFSKKQQHLALQIISSTFFKYDEQSPKAGVTRDSKTRASLSQQL